MQRSLSLSPRPNRDAIAEFASHRHLSIFFRCCSLSISNFSPPSLLSRTLTAPLFFSLLRHSAAALSSPLSLILQPLTATLSKCCRCRRCRVSRCCCSRSRQPLSAISYFSPNFVSLHSLFLIPQFILFFLLHLSTDLAAAFPLFSTNFQRCLSRTPVVVVVKLWRRSSRWLVVVPYYHSGNRRRRCSPSPISLSI